MRRAGAVCLTGLNSTIAPLKSRMALTAGFSAVALINRIGALVRAALLNVDAACITFKTSDAQTSAIVAANAMVAAVGFAHLFFAAKASKTFLANASAIGTDSTIVAVMCIFARELLAQVPCIADHAAARSIVTSPMLAARLRAWLARTICPTGVRIALACATNTRAPARAVIGATLQRTVGRKWSTKSGTANAYALAAHTMARAVVRACAFLTTRTPETVVTCADATVTLAIARAA